VRGHGRYAEAGTDVEASPFRKSYDPIRGQVGVFLRRARRPLVASEIYPNAIPHGKIHDPLPECIDDACTVLVWSYLRERRRCTVTGAKAGLPVGGVDAGDDDVDADFAGRRFGQIAIDEPEDRWVTGT
jgi:hypothetical protein